MGKIALMISLDVLKFKIEKSLHQFGLNETISISGQSLSLSLAKLSDDEVDLIIIDIDNPDHDAMEIIQKLKSLKKSKRIPVVAIGNASDKATMNKVILSGCVEYFNKPLDDITFVGKIHTIIKDLHNTPIRKSPAELDQDIQHNNPEVLPDKALNFIDVKFTWNPIFETGVAFIDDDHLRIIEAYEKLYHLMKEGNGHEYCEDLISFLENYIDTHFSVEEASMLETNYPDKDNHILKHRFFTDKVANLKENLVLPVSNDELIKINLFIKEWLIQHILYEDKKLAAYYIEHHQK